jgi:Type IV pilus assembly protein PilM
MQVWQHLWQNWRVRGVRQSWGLALMGRSGALVGLSRDTRGVVRVQLSTVLAVPAGTAVTDHFWVTQTLQEAGRLLSGRAHTLVVGLDAPDVVMGSMTSTLDVTSNDGVADVQLEVSQALHLPPDEVNFDFEVDTLGRGFVRQIHWAGCAKSQVSAIQKGVNEAGWRLSSVEPAMHAAKRAASALVGGLPSLMQQAPQDWQFRWRAMDEPVSLDDEGMATVRDAGLLQEALTSSVGPRLVACGLALKAWS